MTSNAAEVGSTTTGVPTVSLYKCKRGYNDSFSHHKAAVASPTIANVDARAPTTNRAPFIGRLLVPLVLSRRIPP